MTDQSQSPRVASSGHDPMQLIGSFFGDKEPVLNPQVFRFDIEECCMSVNLKDFNI